MSWSKKLYGVVLKKHDIRTYIELAHKLINSTGFSDIKTNINAEHNNNSFNGHSLESFIDNDPPNSPKKFEIIIESEKSQNLLGHVDFFVSLNCSFDKFELYIGSENEVWCTGIGTMLHEHLSERVSNWRNFIFSFRHILFGVPALIFMIFGIKDFVKGAEATSFLFGFVFYFLWTCSVTGRFFPKGRVILYDNRIFSANSIMLFCTIAMTLFGIFGIYVSIVTNWEALRNSISIY